MRADEDGSGVRRCWADLVGLVLPVACGGCEALDVALCDACASRLLGRPARCEQGAGRRDRRDGRGPLPVWATTPYTGPVRELVVAWKDRGRADLTIGTKTEADRRVWTADARVSDLGGRLGETAVTLRDPATVAATIFESGGVTCDWH